MEETCSKMKSQLNVTFLNTNDYYDLEERPCDFGL